MIEAQILKGEHFTSYLEQEPYVRELVNAYMNSKFKIVLEILDEYSVRTLHQQEAKVFLIMLISVRLRPATTSTSTSARTYST